MLISANVAAKLLAIALALYPSERPGRPQFRGKVMRGRAVVYPLLPLAIPLETPSPSSLEVTELCGLLAGPAVSLSQDLLARGVSPTDLLELRSSVRQQAMAQLFTSAGVPTSQRSSTGTRVAT